MMGPTRMPGVPGLRSRGARLLRLALWVLAAGLLGLLAAYASDGLAPDARGTFVRRFGIWIAFGLGIVTPHVLLPDPALRLLQLANPAGGRLYVHQLVRWLPMPLALSVPAVVIALRAPVDGSLLAEGVLATLAVGLFAFDRYARVGPRSWDWQDGRSGRWLKTFIRRAPIFRLFVPYGLVPSLGITLQVALFGSALAIAGRAFEAQGWPFVPVLAVVLVGLAIAMWRPFATDFYATNGFWAETFRSATGAEERAPAPFSAVYWVPSPLKPSVWALLVSLDRRLPLGRFVLVGIAIVIGLAVSGAPSGVVGAALVALVVAKNAAVALTASDELVPSPWSLSVQSAARWFGARAFVNLRWLPLIAVAAVLAGIVGDRPGSLAVWIALDLVLSLLVAAVVTLAAEARVARDLA